MEDIIFKKIDQGYSADNIFAIYPPDKNDVSRVIYLSKRGYYREYRTVAICYIKAPVTDDALFEAINIRKATLKTISVSEAELANFLIPPEYESIDEYQIKIINNSIDFSDEEISNLILNNPKYNCKIKQYYTREEEKTFYTMPKYKGKATELAKEDEVRYIHEINTKEYIKWREDYFSDYYGRSSTSANSINIAMKHPEHEDGIIFYMFKYKISLNKNIITHNITLSYKVEHVPGVISKATRYVRKQPVEVNAFEAFNINSQNITWGGNIVWMAKAGNNYRSFFMENLPYLEKSGFLTLLKNNANLQKSTYYYSSNLIGSFIVIFVALLVTYPVFELLIKMGHSKMFYDAYEAMKEKGSKWAIDEYVKKFEELVDNTATKGNAVLRFPTYIGEYLRSKSASVDEYFYWRDIYELENLSKEVFERIINSYQFSILNFEAGVRQLPNILKYGYKLEKLINFVVKKHMDQPDENVHYNIPSYLESLRDYLHMCDMLGITPDKYPQDLTKVHNEVAALFREKEKSINDSTFKRISMEASKYVIPTPEDIADEKKRTSKMWEDYTVVFPSSAKDLVEEGMQQHNCVGSYNRHIINGYCIIFFIRKKNDPNKSFITAECTRSGLNQCMYQNNRRVTEDNLRSFASSICSKLLTGVRSGQIHALERLNE